MDNSILIKNIRAVDVDMDKVSDIYIENGYIIDISENIADDEAQIIDGTGLVAMPSLFDMHVHFRDPGFTYKEDIVTGSKAALAGGFTGVACMPNTKPPIDNVDIVNYILCKAKNTGVNVYPVGCITQGMKGEQLCDYELLKAVGVKAISDDGRPVKNAELLRQALVSSNETGMLVISHCEDLDIIGKGIMHKGTISEKLGVEGMDRASEDSITAREIALATASNARIHIAHVSTKGSVELIRDAKRRGVKVSCETAPHYLMLTHDKLLSKDADFRMNPPLRENQDRLALIEGILDGTIDCIATDHAPHSPEEKKSFTDAPNGTVGLETSLAAVLTSLYHTEKVSLRRIVELMAVNPRKLLDVPPVKLKAGYPASLLIADVNREWAVKPDEFESRAKNSVFKGMILKGKPLATISMGKLVYSNF